LGLVFAALARGEFRFACGHLCSRDQGNAWHPTQKWKIALDRNDPVQNAIHNTPGSVEVTAGTKAASYRNNRAKQDIPRTHFPDTKSSTLEQ